MKLIPLLKYLSNVDDVRNIIRQIVDKRNNEVDFNAVNKILMKMKLKIIIVIMI